MKFLILMFFAALAAAGCNQTREADAPAAVAAPELQKVFVAAPPANPIAVTAARKDAKPGDTVAVAGRVKDFVDGAAVFTIADEQLKRCTPDECETPTDYCCSDPAKLKEGLATVKVVDENGKPLLSNLKGINKLDGLVQVSVEGKALRDDAGNLTIAADKIYVQQ